jgi:hypothetical protein
MGQAPGAIGRFGGAEGLRRTLQAIQEKLYSGEAGLANFCEQMPAAMGFSLIERLDGQRSIVIPRATGRIKVTVHVGEAKTPCPERF